MDYPVNFFHVRQNTIEKIEDELRPLESAFQNMLQQNSLTPETREKITHNLETFSELREHLYKCSQTQTLPDSKPKTEPKKVFLLF